MPGTRRDTPPGVHAWAETCIWQHRSASLLHRWTFGGQVQPAFRQTASWKNASARGMPPITSSGQPCAYRSTAQCVVSTHTRGRKRVGLSPSLRDGMLDSTEQQPPAGDARRSRAHEGRSSGSSLVVQEVVRSVSSALDAGDPIRAMALLNGRVRLRYTGVFQVDPPWLRNVCLFDRENPALNVSGGVSSVDIGYCGIACETNSPFATSDARRDSRLELHPARDSMLSYAGVPIRTASGIAWGTLCHFDSRPRLVPESEMIVLQAVVPSILEWLRGRGLLPCPTS